MRTGFLLFLKGLAMGAANVVPGVSGGTIALVTGIYERLILALKSINPDALRLALQFRWNALWRKTDAAFLLLILFGTMAGIISLARLFSWLLETHVVLTMAFFFGLILASIHYVAKTVHPWTPLLFVFLSAGLVIAVAIALLAPASENSHPVYVFGCGIVAAGSMILPGLSGSFVLILMGNYALVLRAINAIDLGVLVPLAAGCAVGILGFVQILGWLLRRFHDTTLAVMTGFIAGSLLTLWPWKQPVIQEVEFDGVIRQITTGYHWLLPDFPAAETATAFLMTMLGALLLIFTEALASRLSSST